MAHVSNQMARQLPRTIAHLIENPLFYVGQGSQRAIGGMRILRCAQHMYIRTCIHGGAHLQAIEPKLSHPCQNLQGRRLPVENGRLGGHGYHVQFHGFALHGGGQAVEVTIENCLADGFQTFRQKAQAGRIKGAGGGETVTLAGTDGFVTGIDNGDQIVQRPVLRGEELLHGGLRMSGITWPLHEPTHDRTRRRAGAGKPRQMTEGGIVQCLLEAQGKRQRQRTETRCRRGNPGTGREVVSGRDAQRLPIVVVTAQLFQMLLDAKAHRGLRGSQRTVGGFPEDFVRRTARLR